MKRTHDKKPNQSITSAKPTTLNLQTRPFAPLQSDSSQDYEITDSASTQAKGITSENMLERLISTSKPDSTAPIQRKPHNHLKSLRMPIQAKLSIGEPNDKYEQEADATAAKVVQQINAPQNQSIQREASMEEEDELQMKPAISKIQRQGSMEEEDELQMKSLVQRRENIGGGEASTDLESSIQRARGSGQSLDARLKAKMGQAMGADFNNVKVHTNSQSDHLNKSIQAKANSQELSEERQPNQTGLPDGLKSGIESLSGISMDNVNVHYNSSAPLQFGALAYTQGSDIHVASGQEEHLPHEAWHVVQQAQGRVKPTMQMKDGINVNTSEGLEHEADVMGRKATQQSNISDSLTSNRFPKEITQESPHQFKLPMKDSGPAERTNGSASDLRRETNATIRRGDRSEIENDIRKLDKSIENRRNGLMDGLGLSSHEARIALEEELLRRLRNKLKTLPKPKPEKQKPPKVVKQTPPKSKFSNNMFDALSNM